MQDTYEPSKEVLETVEYDKYERLPVVPSGWPPDAGKIWQDTCLLLKNSGYLSKAFMPTLRRYCFAVYQAQVAEKMLLVSESGSLAFVKTEVGTEGQTYEVINKWLTVLDSANRTIQQLGAKFGFTPIDAAKVPKVKKVDTSEDNLIN